MSNISIEWEKKLNTKELNSKFFDKDTMYFIHATLYKLYFPYVPFGESGQLSESVDITDKGITHRVPYASRQYFGDGFNFRTDMHPLACAQWDQVCLDSGGSDKLETSIDKYIARRFK